MARAFLIVHLGDASRVVELRDQQPVRVGDPELPHLHANVTRRGDAIELEHLRGEGTVLNGQPITGTRRLAHGDELAIGGALATVTISSDLRRPRRVASIDEGKRRLESEIDRAVRYRRPVTVAMLRIGDDERADAIARAMRPMDVLAEYDGDAYLAILPELGRTEGLAAIAKLHGVERRALAVCPEDGITAHAMYRVLAGAPSVPAATSPGVLALAPAMVQLYALVERIADSAMTVLVLGETGVGKELIAEALHQRSLRRDEPFVKLNCGALPEHLLESELFGHERGAFTGADRRKIGYFEATGSGTIFLDEIGEMPLNLQVKLLRVLERRVFTRVGGTSEVRTSARVVAATHRDLDAEVALGRFRADLLFRIGGFTMTVPPLRDRATEILPLAEHFIRQGSVDRIPPVLTADAKEALTAYGWPGNVRELRNAIDRALVLAADEISTAELPERLSDVRVHPATRDVRGQLATIERAAIVTALQKENNNQTRAARRVGLSRRAFIYKLEKYGLKAPPPRGR